MSASLAFRMQRPEHLNQAARWRALFRFDKSRIAPAIAIRNTIGIVAPLIVGVVMGNVSAGAVGALAAMSVSYSDSSDPYVARARRMLLATALVSVAVTIGALVGHSLGMTVAAAALWAFAAGMMVLFSVPVGNLGVTSLVTLVVFAARQITPVQAIQSGLIAVCAGVLQTVLAIAFWPVNRYEPERRIIGSLYDALSKLAVSPVGQGSAPPATVQLAETQKVLSSLAHDRTRQAERYTFLVNQAERIRLALLTLRRLMRRIGRDPDGRDAAFVIEHILAASSATLSDAAHAVVSQTGFSNDMFQRSAAEFRKIARQRKSALLSAAIRDAGHQIDALAGQLRAVRNLLTASADGLEAPAQDVESSLPERPNSPIAVLRANLSFNSTAFRHAVRLAICVAAGEAVGHFINVQRTYWLAMTIAIVLRPDYSSTFTRGVLRIAGTLVGLLLATVLFHVLHTGRTSEIVLLSVFAFLLRWIGPANYGVFVTAVSAYIVVLFAISGTSPAEVISARALNTLLGGGIALAAYRMWPTWERTRAGPVLAALMDAYREYFHSVMNAYATGSSGEQERNRARIQARLARSNAEAFISRVAGEPGMTVDRANLLSGILSSAHNFVRAVMALESGLYANPLQHPRPATLEFAGKVEVTLQALAVSLRTSKPLPRLPDLREAHNSILATVHTESSQYTLINTETDRITTSIDTLSLQILRWIRS